ncbi:hypothetical protein CR513_47001, partial [Mucuna pruriens]
MVATRACNDFKTFKAFVEKQSGCRIKVLKTDKGQEYLICTNFFEQHGIQHQLTTRYTLTKWKVVATSIYILNVSNKKCCDKTPEDAWSKRRSSIKHLRVFGCIAYAHVPDQLKKKLDDKGEGCIFIGYSTISKAYKLYNQRQKDWSLKSQKEEMMIHDNYEENERQMDSIPSEPKSSNKP